MIAIPVGGGGQGKGPIKKGTIVVTYPSGATCTVTNGSQTYTALDTSGAAAFIVEPGTWTVTAVQGSDSASQSVTVTAGGWAEVELTFGLVLFDGADNTAVTGGWTATGAGNISVVTQNGKLIFKNTSNGQSQNGQWYVGPQNKIDLTDYKTLVVVIDSINMDTAVIGVGSSQSYYYLVPPPGGYAVASTTVTGAGTYSLDVSGVSGSHYIGYGTYKSTQNNYEAVFSDWRLLK